MHFIHFNKCTEAKLRNRNTKKETLIIICLLRKLKRNEINLLVEFSVGWYCSHTLHEAQIQAEMSSLFTPCIMLTSNYNNQQMHIKQLKIVHNIQNNSYTFGRRQKTHRYTPQRLDRIG